MKARMYGHRRGWKKRLAPTSAKTLRRQDRREAEALAPCSHNEQVVNIVGTPPRLSKTHVWKCARCGYVYGTPELALRINDSRNVTAVKDYAEASGIVSELREQHMEMGQGNSTFPRMTVVDLSTGLDRGACQLERQGLARRAMDARRQANLRTGKGVPMIQ